MVFPCGPAVVDAPERPLDGRHGWQSYVALVEEGGALDRDGILAALHDVGIGARPGTHAVTELGVYRQRNYPGATTVRSPPSCAPDARPASHNRMDATTWICRHGTPAL